MFAGHVGAALLVGRAERRVNISMFVFAALLLDVVLWLFILLGWESVAIPADFAETHQAHFDFPYSHGLVASVAWSILLGAGVALAAATRSGRLRIAVLIAIAVFSHWLLDALVHVPEMPLAGEGSAKVGLGLWQHLPIALGVEALIVVAGLWAFLAGTSLVRWRKIALVTSALLLLVFTIAGMTVAPPPPSPIAMAASSLVTLLVVCALFAWIGMARSRPS